MSRRHLLSLLASALSLALTSCASVSVKRTEILIKNPPQKLPKTILVKPFSITESGLRVDRRGDDLEAFRMALRERMTKNLVRRLPLYAGPAKAIASTAPLPKGNKWLIEGNFDRVYQGSRFMRAIFGFGLGGTKLDTTIVVSDLSTGKRRPFLLIQTTGGSNISPGVGGVLSLPIQGPMALTSLANAAEAVRSGVTFDTIRTSREINASLSEYLYQQGAIPLEKAIGPKRLGELPNLIAPPDRARRRGAATVQPSA